MKLTAIEVLLDVEIFYKKTAFSASIGENKLPNLHQIPDVAYTFFANQKDMHVTYYE